MLKCDRGHFKKHGFRVICNIKNDYSVVLLTEFKSDQILTTVVIKVLWLGSVFNGMQTLIVFPKDLFSDYLDIATAVVGQRGGSKQLPRTSI